MQTLYLVGLLLIGVIVANIIKQFIPRVPDAFIFVGMGLVLSLTSIFHNFELEPEFFMLVIIAPLMFVDGQRQSFVKIRQKFGMIFMLSVALIIATIIIVGLLTYYVEASWTLPLAIALVAIVTPTDAVAVKSITGGGDGKMPTAVGDALELESLFNDATGLVMLDLALSVLTRGNFSLFSGLQHFAIVALGGILIGIILGFTIVGLRVWLNLNAPNPETTIIPISLLTPFVVYLVAQQLGTSGILAVVATGIVHNWESDRLRLTSTQVQLTSTTIWDTISNILNSIVFMILGLSLPMVWRNITAMDSLAAVQLIGLAILIYVAMLVVRYIWALREDNAFVHTLLLGSHEREQHRQYAEIFAFAGIHGTMTLAMAFSLPHSILGMDFPYRDELITVATLVILISMVVSAVILPWLMPKNASGYTADDLAHVRSKMVDFATLQVRSQIDNHDVREALTSQLQTQKGWSARTISNNEFQLLMDDSKDHIRAYIHSEAVGNKYGTLIINIYDKILNQWNTQIKNKTTLKHEIHVLKKQYKHAKWHVLNGVITPRQRERSREQFKASKSPSEWAKWKDTHNALASLNAEVIEIVDVYLDQVLQDRLDQHQSTNSFIFDVRKTINEYLNHVNHEYSRNSVVVDSDLYIQAFQFEYTFVQRASRSGLIPQSMIRTLYNEISQAQTLQLQQLEQLEEMNIENERLALDSIE